MNKATDLDLLQGEWRITAMELDGNAAPADMLAVSSIVIQDSRFSSRGTGAEYEGEVVLDPSATPHRLDIKFDSGPEKGNVNLGIYETDGDTWRLCLATRGGDRPAKFATAPGSGFALETLTRGTKPAPPKKSKKSTSSAAAGSARDPRPTEFEGEWQMLSGTMDGQPMDESAVKWVKRITQGSLTTIKAGPQVMLQFEFTFDSAQSLKQIDYLNILGQHKGKAQLGIYEFDGGVLRICVAAPGDSRPRQFESTKGDRRTLTTWKRAG